MPNTDLVNYIYNNLQQGFQLEAIKQQLVSQGFTEQDINSAVDYVYANYYYSGKNNIKKSSDQYKSTPGNKVSLQKIAIFVIIIFAAALIGIAGIFLLSGEDISQEAETPEIIPQEKPEEVEEPINQVEEPNDEIEPVEIEEPVDKPEPIEVEIPIEPEKEVDPQAGIDNILEYDEIINEPFDENKKYSYRQIDLKVDYFKAKDPEEAYKFCKEFTKVKSSYCIIEIAVAAKDPNYCSRIESSNIKDDCYIEIAINDIDDESVCINIENAYKRSQICESLFDSKETNMITVENQPSEAINYFDVIENVN